MIQDINMLILCITQGINYKGVYDLFRETLSLKGNFKVASKHANILILYNVQCTYI